MRSRPASLRPALVLLASLLFVPTRAGAVNLVPNPSFENFTSISGCPTSFSNFNDAGPWFTPTLGTSDYFNACASGPFAPGVPTSILGFQPAHTGIAHAGFISNSFQNYHEYCEVQLSSPLANSVLYTVEFWIKTTSTRPGEAILCQRVSSVRSWSCIL